MMTDEYKEWELQSAPISVNLDNGSNLAYSGPVFVGTPMQGLSTASDFIYDTGSGFLTVASTTCDTCDPKYYNPDISTSYKPGY